MKALLKLGVLFALYCCVGSAFANTWYVRTDGGTRYDATNAPLGQCDGKADAAYPGSGTNQHCAYQDFRYLYDDDAGTDHYTGAWVIAGGDTVIIKGCTAGANQIYPSNPNCRVGGDRPTGGSLNNWCYFSPNFPYDCYSAPIPSGTALQHTRILGQNYASCNTGGATNPKTYQSNLTQLFGGFSIEYTLNLSGSQYVDIQCLEITTHNQVSPGNPGAGGNCTISTGSPAYPRVCSSSPPVDDYAQNGILTTNTTGNVTLQDVYIHGFTHDGIRGPIGGVVNMSRVFVGFNAEAGWNFDDGSDTANGSGSQILASYVTMIGNGCFEQYPIVNAFPARACYDSNSSGFGDSWSGQDGVLDVLHCDHCVNEYNTKDGFIGPHTQVTDLQITNSVSFGNMGQQWKWGTNLSATGLFQNNLTVMNCNRMSTTLPGAAQNFNVTTGLGGSYLSNFCRASGNGINVNTRLGSTNKFYGNTWIGANPTMVFMDCAYYTTGNVLHEETNCGAVPNLFKDNLFLGYTDPAFGTDPPGLWFAQTGSNIAFTSAYNSEYGIRNGDTCGVNGILCSNPLLNFAPTTPWPGSESAFDVFDPSLTDNAFSPSTDSPAVGAGTALTGLTTDYYSVVRPNPPSMGAVELSGTPQAATPTFSPVAGMYTSALSVTISSTTAGATLCLTTDGTTPTADGAGTCVHGSTYSGAVTVSVSETLKAIASKSGYLDSGVGTAVYVINIPSALNTTISGTVKISGTFKIQ